MGRKLFVGNLSYDVTEADLREVFAAEGRNVVEAKVVLDRETGRSRGFAFVELSTDAEAADAMASTNGRELRGRVMNVSEARERSGGGGGGYGAGRGGGGRGGFEDTGGGYGGGGRGGRGGGRRRDGGGGRW